MDSIKGHLSKEETIYVPTSTISLHGKNSIQGRSISVVEASNTSKILACGTLVSSGNQNTYAVASISNSKIAGKFEFVQQGLNGDTMITGQISHSDSTTVPTDNHKWYVFVQLNFISNSIFKGSNFLWIFFFDSQINQVSSFETSVSELFLSIHNIPKIKCFRTCLRRYGLSLVGICYDQKTWFLYAKLIMIKLHTCDLPKVFELSFCFIQFKGIFWAKLKQRNGSQIVKHKWTGPKSSTLTEWANPDAILQTPPLAPLVIWPENMVPWMWV